MRTLLEHERPLLAYLFARAALPMREDMFVKPMDDGGMGSLAIAPFEKREVGSAAAECQFDDADGIPVLATLFLDRHGSPLEVDVWKTDYSPLQRWPTKPDLGAVDYESEK